MNQIALKNKIMNQEIKLLDEVYSLVMDKINNKESNKIYRSEHLKSQCSNRASSRGNGLQDKSSRKREN